MREHDLAVAVLGWSLSAAACMPCCACSRPTVEQRRAEPRGAEQHDPAAPLVHVDVTPPPEGRVRRVAPGELQRALDDAQLGDTLVLAAGQSYVGPFNLPRKTGKGWVTVRGEVRPVAGKRAAPAEAKQMPKLIAGPPAVIVADAGAHHYRFEGIELAPSAGEFLENLVVLGTSHTADRDVPRAIVFQHCVFHGDQVRGGLRGIAMNSAYTAVVDSHFSSFGEVGRDSQAIAGWAGPGPFLLENNLLEAAGENVMFGGGDAPAPTRIPSDIVIRGNHLRKPLSWRDDHRREWSVKNLFELKDARRVVVEGNLFEGNWVHAQNGFAILLTVRNEDGRVPWATVEDVTFVNNVVRHSASGFNILGRDDNRLASGRTQRIRIANNLFEDIGGTRWGGGGILFQLLEGSRHVTIMNNTANQTGSIIVADGEPHLGFVFRNNVAPHNEYGILGSGRGSGNAAIQYYFPGSVIDGNVLIGGTEGLYPAGNFFPVDVAQVRTLKAGRGVDPSALRTAYAATGPL